jgi:hypothetical protein
VLLFGSRDWQQIQPNSQRRAQRILHSEDFMLRGGSKGLALRKVGGAQSGHARISVDSPTARSGQVTVKQWKLPADRGKANLRLFCKFAEPSQPLPA